MALLGHGTAARQVIGSLGISAVASLLALLAWSAFSTMQALAHLHKAKSTMVRVEGNAHHVYYHALPIGTLWKHEGTYRFVNGQLSADCGACDHCQDSLRQLGHPKVSLTRHIKMRCYARKLYGLALPLLVKVESSHRMVGTLYRLYVNDHLVAAKDIPASSHWEDDKLIWMGDVMLTVRNVLIIHNEVDVVLDPHNALHLQLIAALIERMRANRPAPPPEMAMMVWDFTLEPLERLLQK